MKILSHRGFWLTTEEKNKPVAFQRSFDQRFGTETDVRDRLGELVIAHDMATQEDMTLAEMLAILDNRHLPIAMNIKADGLAIPLKQTMEHAGVQDWFVFDMAIPDTRSYLRADVPVFTRMSEVEQSPIWLEESAGVWLDAFNEIWYTVDQIEALLEKSKRVCVVSPELHKRAHASLWQMLLPLRDQPALMLCTDLAAEAQIFFAK